MKKCLYVCSTNYTLFNCINDFLSNCNNFWNSADLVVFVRTDDMLPFIKKIQELKIFDNTMCFKFINNESALSKAIIMLHPERELKKRNLSSIKPVFKNNYDKIVAQSSLYASIFIKISPTSDVFFIEDGLSSYTNKTANPAERSKLYTIYNKLRTIGNKYYKGQLLYERNLYMGYEKNEDIFKLPRPSPNTMNVLQKIFTLKVNPIYENGKYVYLGTPLQGIRKLTKNGTKLGNSFENEAENILVKCIDMIRKPVIYRKHPIEIIHESRFNGTIVVDDINNMWEMEVYKSINDEHILMSFFSTASLTPKLLYNKEPYLIFMHKLLKIELYNADDVIEKIRCIYNSKEKVMVPNDFEELKSMLSKMIH